MLVKNRFSLELIGDFTIEAGANLSGANLYGANLFGANLSGANLFRADLSSANLSSAILNWNSRELVSQILLQKAKSYSQKAFASFVFTQKSSCWDDFDSIIKENCPELFDWVVGSLKPYITISKENLPKILKQYK